MTASLIKFWSKLMTNCHTILISGQFGQMGRGCRISPPFRFENLAGVSLGERVWINRDCWISTLSLGGPAETATSKLIIKSDAGIGMGATIAAAQQIVIGEHVLLARNVYIADHSHAYEDVKVPISLQGVSHVSPVSIGRHSWIGQNVSILPGVAVGEHCVIGANSVVNRSIPDFCVAVGSPARAVRKYHPETGRWERIAQT